MQQAMPTTAKGFLKSLYDFSFSSFVTTKVIRVLYIIITVLYSLAAILVFIDLLTRGGPSIIVAIIGVPLAYLLYLTFARIMLEFIIVVFRLGEDVRIIRDSAAPYGGSPPVIS